MRSPIVPLLDARQIQLDLLAHDATAAIREVAGTLHANPAVLDAAALCRDVLAREQVTSTALDRGFALPHARTPAVCEVVLAIGRSRSGVPFGTGAPVHLIFLIGTPQQSIPEYLALVGALMRLLKDDTVRQCLLEAESVEEFIAILT